MKSFFTKILFITVLILRGGVVLAQVPANDECEGATMASNPVNFCGVFNNTGGSPSNLTTNCFTGNGDDVWFTFVAEATEVNISVIGRNTSSSFTLLNPVAELFRGTCGSLQGVTCQAGNANNSIELVRGALQVGEQYYVRVWGSGGTVGTFQFCIKNYNPPSRIDADCPTAAVLCDKSPFSVNSVTGAGRDVTELNDATCFGGNSGNEQQSVWFKWTCAQSGTLTMRINPVFSGDTLTTLGDDIDFAVYELPNGINNCAGKRIVRCMAAGPHPNTVGVAGGLTREFIAARRCQGATGLSDAARDTEERAGCDPGDPHDNFVAALNMVAGQSYAIGINNFSNTGNGFSIEFGGTGTFVGPEANIGIDKTSKRVCLGEEVVFNDNSTFALGQITNRSWDFGRDASVPPSTGAGPFRVYYKTPGWKSVVLRVTTDRGCVVTTVMDSIYVKGFAYDSIVRRPTCLMGNDGMVRLRVTECGRAPILYNWENAGYSTRDSISGLTRGTYRVAVTDASRTYVDTVTFTIKELEVEIDTSQQVITPPTCRDSANALIQLIPTTGASPYQYNWNDGRGWVNDNILRGVAEGQYPVTIRDANFCRGNFVFDVTAPPRVDVVIDTINITCFGRTDGKAIARPSGGVGSFRYSWSTGVSTQNIANLAVGNYTVTVFDANNCPAIQRVTIAEPPELIVNQQSVKGTVCFGDSTGALVVRGNGGTPPYRYSIDGVRFQRDSAFNNIMGQTYSVVVRDSTGCKDTTAITVPSPPQLIVNAGIDKEIDLGFSTIIRTIVLPSGSNVTYTWTPKDSLNCTTCPDVTANPTRTIRYTVRIKDEKGCTATDDVLITVDKKRPIYIPTAFSPNGDGVNDLFTIYGNKAAVIIKDFKIFDRWGGIVFAATDMPLNDERVGWNGSWSNKDLNPDVFTYYAIIKFVDGEELLFKGDVNLIR